MLDFEEVPNLERLNLEGCVELVEMDLSICLPKKLVFLNLKDCKNLISIPNGISGLNSLEYLNLCNCSKAFNNLRHLEWPSLASLSCLREVDISFCSLSHLPGDIGDLSCIERLNLGGNKFVTLPSFTLLSKLEYLNLDHCLMLTSLPELPSPAAIKHDEYWSAGMYMFNCSELDENETERCSRLTFSWMMQFILANQESSASFRSIEFVIPGSKMPIWFNKQREDGSISINPSCLMRDSNVIGIACCVVFSAAPHGLISTTNGQKPVLYLNFHRGDDFELHFSILVNTNPNISSHMWLTYFTRESFFDILKDIGNRDDNCISMEAFIVDGEGLDVKSYGYCWLFKQDLQNFNLITIQAETH